ncbi:MAG TPA: metallophosphoesterase [Verrucomicrobiae bacterium]|nr:metallophosphoesterase [Verrucomicrobiae bacterium]
MSANGPQTSRTGIVLSDLHLFARRSRGDTRFENVRRLLSKADLLVLNGDIFDFRWSTIGNQSKTLSAALDWLNTLAGNLPACQIHFIVGNHDCTASFKGGLTDLARALPSFQWHEHLLQLGPLLFVHGDCAHRRMDKDGLLRLRTSWERDWRWTPAMAVAYEYVDRLGITKRVHEFHFPRQKTVERLVFYLDSSCPGWRKTTRDCYFGHTHLPFANHEHDGIRFHNTGSAIHNLEFNPLCFKFTEAI